MEVEFCGGKVSYGRNSRLDATFLETRFGVFFARCFDPRDAGNKAHLISRQESNLPPFSFAGVYDVRQVVAGLLHKCAAVAYR